MSTCPHKRHVTNQRVLCMDSFGSAKLTEGSFVRCKYCNLQNSRNREEEDTTNAREEQLSHQRREHNRVDDCRQSLEMESLEAASEVPRISFNEAHATSSMRLEGCVIAENLLPDQHPRGESFACIHGCTSGKIQVHEQHLLFVTHDSVHELRILMKDILDVQSADDFATDALALYVNDATEPRVYEFRFLAPVSDFLAVLRPRWLPKRQLLQYIVRKVPVFLCCS